MRHHVVSAVTDLKSQNMMEVSGWSGFTHGTVTILDANIACSLAFTRHALRKAWMNGTSETWKRSKGNKIGDPGQVRGLKEMSQGEAGHVWHHLQELVLAQTPLAGRDQAAYPSCQQRPSSVVELL
jgi:hypothetical protein